MYSAYYPEITTGDGAKFWTNSVLYFFTLVCSVAFAPALWHFLRFHRENGNLPTSASASDSVSLHSERGLPEQKSIMMRSIFARHSHQFYCRYSLLWVPFVPKRWYWNCVLIGVRLLMLIASALGIYYFPHYPTLRLSLLGAIIGAYWAAHEYYQPMQSKNANILYSATNIGLVIILAATAILDGAYQADLSYSSAVDTATLKNTFRAIVAVVSAAVFLLAAVAFFRNRLRNLWQ